MKITTQESGKSLKMQSAPVRASISFPPNLYETLEEIAKQKKASLAWVVRDAAEKYIADQPAETSKARADAR
jgi:metal-responsive CopG/Arc/MetJ family transcriptional regulator